MSKSTLSITLPAAAYQTSPKMTSRTVEVPCRLPESFNFKFAAFGTTLKATAYLSGFDAPAAATVGSVELVQGPDVECEVLMTELAESILATIKAALGITGPVPPGSPLPAIALAYEAECAAYNAFVKAYAAAPPAVRSLGMVPNEPSDETATGIHSPSARLLAKYVEHVVEQAANVTP